MIIVKIKGGLGNQLFQYAIGHALSNINNCKLYLDTTWFEKNNLDTPRVFMLPKFNIKYKIATDHQIKKFINNSSIIYKFIDKVKNYLLPLKYKKCIYEIGNSFNPDVFQLKGNIYLDGYWMNENYFSSISSHLREIYSIRPVLNNYYEQIENLIKSTNSVCVHIRRGDYAYNPNTLKYHGLTTLKYYEHAINIMLNEVDNPQFYFFSDDIKWVKNNFNNISNCIFVSSDFSDSDIQEFYLMAVCRNQIIANSTFSWWAAWLNRNPTKIVCAPRIWSSKIQDSQAILPDDWLIINEH